MCAACDGLEQHGIAPALLARARAIEELLPGEPVPEQAWRILAGVEGGAVAWADHRRMLGCLESAAAIGQGGTLRCDAAPATPAWHRKRPRGFVGMHAQPESAR